MGEESTDTASKLNGTMASGPGLMVMKFGGSSLQDGMRMLSATRTVRQSLSTRPIVVVSAMGSTTSLLIDALRRRIDKGIIDLETLETFHVSAASTVLEKSACMIEEIKCLFSELRSVLNDFDATKDDEDIVADRVMSFGERLSVRLFAAFLMEAGVPSKAYDAYDIGMRTAGTYTGSAVHERVSATVCPSSYNALKSHLGSLKVHYSHTPIVTGFIAKSDKTLDITTLGRGGSDLTAAVIGAALKAQEVQIWTDTDGVLTADPRVVKGTRCIEFLTFDEASELASSGAKVLHPFSILPAMAHRIPVRVKNSFNRSHPGTMIAVDASFKPLAASDKPEKGAPCRHCRSALTTIAFKAPIHVLDIKSTLMLGQHGFLAEVFAVFERERISVDVVATGEVSISVTLDKDTTPAQIENLTKGLMVNGEPTLHANKAILALIGDRLRAVEVMQKSCEVLAGLGIPLEMASLGACGMNTSLVIPADFAVVAVQKLHDAFFS